MKARYRVNVAKSERQGLTGVQEAELHLLAEAHDAAIQT